MKIVVVAKTRKGSGACIGALTFSGKSLRLEAEDEKTNNRFNMDYEIGEVWEVETRPDPNIVPPHIENVIVTKKRRLAPITGIATFIEKQMPPVSGGREAIFENLTQNTSEGSLYLAERRGIPSRSTMFWIPDKDLQRDTKGKRIRYRYPTENGGFTLTFTGFQEPIEEIPAGTLLRVSTAHWWRPPNKPNDELRCYVQLSGWFGMAKTRPTENVNRGQTSSNSRASQKNVRLRQKEKNTVNPAPSALNLKHILQEKFGYPEFRALQEEIIQNVLKKRDSLAVMPTGSGKSLCYQLPATIFEGLTVVVSPLISLMEDQVLELREWGIPALYLNSTLTYAEYGRAVARVRSGEIKLLYGAPETLLRPETILLLENSRVEAIVIDEAHCISEWGHDFRPEYRQLNELRRKLPQATTLALTATATRRVREDIKRTLGIASANEFIGSFDRPNLFLSVVDKVAGVAQARDFLNRHKNQAGIIYCSTRDNVDNLTAQLESEGFPVLPYHAGMDDKTRRAHQRRFRYEDNLIIVATIAFGMGINKSNVRFILHYNLPKNVESYYQQIGRAGRDGLRADCMLLFSYSDVRTIRYFISQNAPELRQGAETRLSALLAFVDALNCRRIPLLDYFGETYQGENCKACDNCLDADRTDHARPEQDTVKENLTLPARLFVKTALETKQIFGSAHLIDTLRGSRAKKVLKFGHDKISTYGAGKEYSKEYWQHIAIQFIRLGLLKRTKPHGSLVITDAGKAVLAGKEVWAKVDKGFIKSTEKPQYNETLFEKLRLLRAKIAQEKNIPPYVIFHDRTLVEMASYFPHTEADLRQIYGVGGRKMSEYAPRFLPLIQAYCRENALKPLTKPKTHHSVPLRVQARAKRLSSKTGRQRSEYVWQEFQAGKSIEQIAKDMGFKPGTIFRHLQKAHAEGREINAEYLKKSSKLSPEEGQRVIEAFKEHGDTFLSPIFNALNEEISYDEIRLWKMVLEVEKGVLGE